MTPSNMDLSISVTDKAAAFIKSKRLKNPLILVNLSQRSADSGGGCGDSCGGGGCGEGQSGHAAPIVSVMMVEGGKVGSNFVRVDTGAGIPVYVAKSLYEVALRSGIPLTVTVKGLVMKKLVVEGLDLTSPSTHSTEGESHQHHG